MANHKSAIKRARQTKKINERNRSRRSKVRAAAKSVEITLLKDGVEAATKALRKAESALARAAGKKTMHWKTAARKTSRLAKKIKAAALGGSAKTKKK